MASVQLATGQVILKEDFESGAADAAVPTNAAPWRVNDSGIPVRYRTTDHPFASGTQYGYVNDNVSGAGSTGTRFMSTDAADTDQVAAKIGGKITTLSFDFWEPTTDNASTNQPGLGIGYYGAGIDMNAAGRNYRAFLRDGMLNPDSLVAGAGAGVAYTRGAVQTIFMLCNDTATALENYRDSRTLAANQADVWIQAAGGDPVFAFSVSNQHAGTPNRGIGFRTFTLDTEEIYLNNILLNTGASFDRSAFQSGVSRGDYNGDGDVDGEDFLAWQQQFDADVAQLTGADGSGNGKIDAADLDVWSDNFGGPGAVASALGVPEPSWTAILLPATSVFCGWRRNRGVR